MKKVIDFLKNNGVFIVGIMVAILLLSTVFAPLFVAIGRYMWDVALNNPSALFC